MESLKQMLGRNFGKEGHRRLVEVNPSIGFRASYDNSRSKLTVTVIGARHLPVKVANVAAAGYSVKVTLYPTKEKFITSTKPEPWSKYDERFSFDLFKEFFTSASFLVLSSYVVGRDGRSEKLGTVTWPLLADAFRANEKFILETSDMWIEMTGMEEFFRKKELAPENQRLLATLLYEADGIGKGSVLVMLTSLRLPADIIRELRTRKAEVHIKIGLHDGNAWLMPPLKRAFPPDISYHWNGFEYQIPMTRLEFLDDEWYIRIVVSSKPQYFGRKTVIGSAHITSTCEQWKKTIQEPNCSTKEWHGIFPDIM